MSEIKKVKVEGGEESQNVEFNPSVVEEKCDADIYVNSNENEEELENEIKTEKDSKRDGSNNSKNKKRTRDTRVEAINRLCGSVEKNEPCTFPGCSYEHDPIKFLSSKPSDIGDVCFRYEIYGYCPSGLMCRFGKSHIDFETGKNISRSIDQGGVIERLNINLLSKELQVMLRKKKYVPKEENKMKVEIQESIVGEQSLTTNEKTSSETSTSSSVPALKVTKDKMQDLSAYASFVKLVDFSNKVYVAPLTTVGNLPFRRILKDFGADITCGEMAMAQNIEQGQASEWALLRKHESENIFGVQLASHHCDQLGRVCKILENETSTDFVDLNCGYPIDVVCSRGCGSALLQKPARICDLVKTMAKNLTTRSITVKIRTGWSEKDPMAHKLLPQLQKAAPGRLAAVMIHGRSRQQRYSKAANWEYILQAAKSQDPTLPILPVIGNGDILSWEDWNSHRTLLRDNMDSGLDEVGLCSCAMIGRGALMKPWLPAEIKQGAQIDISASDRLDMLKKFCNYGLEHWGSDQQGVNTTRRFLLEWLSFLHRYSPVGLLEAPQKMQDRPPRFVSRSDLEELLSSADPKDWIRISTMLLGPVPDNFYFEPKHKSYSYSSSESNAQVENDVQG